MLQIIIGILINALPSAGSDLLDSAKQPTRTCLCSAADAACDRLYLTTFEIAALQYRESQGQ